MSTPLGGIDLAPVVQALDTQTLWVRIMVFLMRVIRMLGITGLAGLFLGVVVLSVSLVTLSNQQQRIQKQQQHLIALQKTALAPLVDRDSGRQWAQLSGYRKTFPEANQLQLIWSSIAHLATQEQIQVEQAIFQQAVNTTAGFGRVEVVLPLKSSYLPLKRFLVGVFNQHKTVAIESLSLDRTKASDPVFNVDLRLVMYYQLAGEI